MIVHSEVIYHTDEDDGLGSGAGVNHRDADIETLSEDGAPHRCLDLLLLALLQGDQ